MHKYILLLFWILNFTSHAQIKELYSIDKKYEITGVDNNGNSYLLDKNTIYKIDKKGNVIFNFSDNSKGNITDIDITNPFKIIVLYADALKLVILDNKLSPIGSDIDLNLLDINDPIVACSSDDNGFWIYDASSGKFYLFSWTNQKKTESVDIRVIFDKIFNPSDMIKVSNYTLINVPKIGVTFIDIMGNYLKTINFNQDVSITPNGIIQINQNNLIIYDYQKNTESSVKLDTTDIKNVYMNFPYILIEYKNKIILYLLTDNF